MTRRSTLIEDFTYQLLITCLDVEDDTFITEDHNNNVNITFIRTTTTAGYTSTPISTTLTTPIRINGTSNGPIVHSSVTASSSAISSTQSNKETTSITAIGSNQTDQMMGFSNEGASTGGDGFFDNALNLASVTSSIGIAAVIGVAVACYRIYKKVKQRPRLTPVREL